MRGKGLRRPTFRLTSPFQVATITKQNGVRWKGMGVAEYLRLLSLSDAELERFDLVEMNLLVAKSIPALADLDIPRYQRLADEWAEAVRERLGRVEGEFWKTPQDWDHCIHLFRLGVLAEYVECELGIEYNEDQRESLSIRYTDPSDLFLNGVTDRRRGTCGNMATLHVAIGRRLGWPVSLACVRSHLICRYDDGEVRHNIEATQSGHGGFKTDSDEHLIAKHRLPDVAIRSGSDLRALTTREMLGVFVGFRARHMRDIGNSEDGELDALLARRLFPNSRRLYIDAMAIALPRGKRLFEPGEVGSPESLADVIREQYGWPSFPVGVPVLPVVCSPLYPVVFRK